MIRALAIILTLSAPAMAKDMSRVPATGPDYQVMRTTFVRTCRTERVKFTRHGKNKTTVEPRSLDCVVMIEKVSIEPHGKDVKK